MIRVMEGRTTFSFTPGIGPIPEEQAPRLLGRSWRLRADLVAWDVAHPAELCYWLGGQLVARAYVAGQPLS